MDMLSTISKIVWIYNCGTAAGTSVQLRYFILLPEYHVNCLGRKLMLSFIDFMYEKKYRSAYCGLPMNRLRPHHSTGNLDLYSPRKKNQQVLVNTDRTTLDFFAFSLNVENPSYEVFFSAKIYK
jgi:hypothetical protein